MRIKLGLSPYLYLAIFACTVTASHHFVTGSEDFVIVNSDNPQLYKLFGFLPILNTWKVQLVYTSVLAVSIGLPLLLFFYFRPRHPYADWTSRLPDSFVNFLFYLQFELAAYKNLLLGEMAALMSSPASVGLDMAANLSSWSPLGSRARRERQAVSGTVSRTGRSALRRKQNHTSGGANGSRASSSKAAINQANGADPSYYPGLYNTGNSCFLNSTLQCLGSLHILGQYLDSVMELAETWDVPTPVTDALHDLICSLNTSEVKRSALIPRQLTDALSSLPQTNVGSFFYAHQQQDAHELLVLLTSAIDDEMNLVLSERDHVQRRQAVGLRAAVAPSVPSLYSASSFASTSTNPFRSLIAQRTACLDCGYVEAVRHYPTDELSLGVPFRAGSATTLEMCLRNWSKLERVDWICFRCSLQKTLDKVRADLKRMASKAGVNGHSIDGNGMANGVASKATGITTNGNKFSNSKKKKLREVRRKESVLVSILEGRLSEDEVESSHLLDNASIKLERAFSSLSTKQVMIARTPKVLTLHLNRSSYSAGNFGASKNNTPVLFDEYLDLSEVVTSGELNISGNLPISRGSSPARDADGQIWSDRAPLPLANGNGYLSSQPLYQLCAIVVHYGSHSAGHYISYRRRRLKRKQSTLPLDDVDQGGQIEFDAWFRISDDSVSPCSLQDVLSQNPFLLFYERANDCQRLGRRMVNTPTTTTQNGLDKAPMPKGFEAFDRDELNKRRSAFHPRVVERWST